MFKSYYHQNILKPSGLLLTSKSCYLNFFKIITLWRTASIYNIHIQQVLFFSFLKKPGLKAKKVINVNYLIIVLIKMRLLIFLVLVNMY